MSTTKIEQNTVATVHYRGTLTESGNEFDNSYDREPLSFLVGFGQMIPGFEAALIGKSVDDAVTFELAPEDAYGQRDPDAVQEVPLSQLPDQIKPGDRLAAQAPDGNVIPLTVTAINEETATLDMNHELAGETLTFEVKVIEVRAATEEELSHGHVHGPGGHQH